VSTAYNGAEALESMTTRTPAVLVFDIGMPGMDGYELARRTRATPEGAEILLIALTGWGDDEERRIAAGIDHHLVKPVDLGVIESLLAARRAAPAAGAAL
jgi:CheY-like chemotaxis protein